MAEEMNVWTLIKAGGPVMAPIILCSLFALAIVIEKLMHFASIQTDVVQLKKNIFQNVIDNHVREAVEICRETPSPVAKVFKAGLEKFGASRIEIEQNMNSASLLEIPKLERHMFLLATIAHISPLLGLLGTVAGMITCFHTIQVRAASLSPISPCDLAGGIWEALITTLAGLVVAIPTFVVHNYCVNRIDRIILEMERAATELVNFMGQIAETKAS